MNWIYKLTTWYFTKQALPYWCILLIDCAVLMGAGVLSLYATKGGSIFVAHFWEVIVTLACTLPCFAVGMKLFHTYSGVIRYSSFADLLRITLMLVVGFLICNVIVLALPIDTILHDFRVRDQLLMFLISMVGMWAVRIMVKYLFESSFRGFHVTRVFVYGVREGGIGLAKSIKNEQPAHYLVKGFISEEPSMVGRFLVGTNVYAPGLEAVAQMRRLGVKALLISPKCNDAFRDNEELVNAVMKAGIKIMMMPSAEAWDGKSKLSHTQLKEVDIEELLPREKIEVDMDAIGRLLSGKRILITGAAGSIGGEMVRQVAKFEPSRLVLVDQAETPMHDVRLYMSRNHPEIDALTVVGSISNQTHMEELFREHQPDYVFHAAAYKHVPMMEDNPAMAIQNNTYGTRVIADLAVKYGTKKFVMISTDKAVNPTNVMGCSKRICEIYCQALNKAIQEGRCPIANVREGDGGKPVTQFITTRFGNVLGSNGSVIPIFKEQIRKGGPVTVTHPDIIRFFMLIPEACRLVLEAGTMGNGGEIFVFDMGKPVRIADLAQRMIDLSGAKGVEIKFTGLRDGEKLYEEVLNDQETTKPTIHPKIMIAAVREVDYDKALADEEELYRLSFTYDDMAIVKKMKDIVPEYRSQHSKYEALDK